MGTKTWKKRKYRKELGKVQHTETNKLERDPKFKTCLCNQYYLEYLYYIYYFVTDMVSSVTSALYPLFFLESSNKKVEFILSYCIAGH